MTVAYHPGAYKQVQVQVKYMQQCSHASSLSKSTPRIRHLLVPMLLEVQPVLRLVLVDLVVDEEVGGEALLDDAAPVGVGVCDPTSNVRWWDGQLAGAVDGGAMGGGSTDVAVVVALSDSRRCKCPVHVR